MNRLAAVAFLLFAISFGSEALAVVLEPGVERQEVAVTLLPESHGLFGESSITLTGRGGPASFRLNPAVGIDSVTACGKKARYSFAHGVLSIDVPTTSPAATCTVAISYHGAFNDPISQRPGASEDPSYGVSGAITKEGTFLGDSAFWYPVPPQPPAHRSVKITAPSGTEAITFGKLVSRQTTPGFTHSQWEEARPVGALTLCAGPYLVQSRRVGGIDLYSYLYADNAALAASYLDATAEYVKFYSGLLGPYPFEKFAVVENFFQTGYGLPSFTLIGGMVLRLPFIIHTSLPHEIAHSWWGNGVEVDLAEGNWSEGLVSYLADYLLRERFSAEEGLEYRKQLLIDYASLVTPATDFPLQAFVSRTDPASRAIGYGKGAMVFHMVRSMIGDKAFFTSLSEVFRDHKYGSASWGDFVRAFSRNSGRNLAPFLEQWLVRPGAPALALADVTTRHDASGWTVSGTISQPPPFFALQLPLTLETAGKPVTRDISVTGERTSFTISTADEPRRLLLDPQAQVFRKLSPQEIPATVNSLKGSRSLMGVFTANCRTSAELFRDLLASLSQGGARVISEAELEQMGAGPHDLLFCGMPRNRSLLPEFPDYLSVSASQFAVKGKTYSPPDGLLFLVLPVPGKPGQVSALFEPLSDPAAQKYAPKITHYGKYGYLLFAGGGNQEKGTLPVADGGTSVSLKVKEGGR